MQSLVYLTSYTITPRDININKYTLIVFSGNNSVHVNDKYLIE